MLFNQDHDSARDSESDTDSVLEHNEESGSSGEEEDKIDEPSSEIIPAQDEP